MPRSHARDQVGDRRAARRGPAGRRWPSAGSACGRGESANAQPVRGGARAQSAVAIPAVELETRFSTPPVIRSPGTGRRRPRRRSRSWPGVLGRAVRGPRASAARPYCQRARAMGPGWRNDVPRSRRPRTTSARSSSVAWPDRTREIVSHRLVGSIDQGPYRPRVDRRAAAMLGPPASPGHLRQFRPRSPRRPLRGVRARRGTRSRGPPAGARPWSMSRTGPSASTATAVQARVQAGPAAGWRWVAPSQ